MMVCSERVYYLLGILDLRYIDVYMTEDIITCFRE